MRAQLEAPSRPVLLAVVAVWLGALVWPVPGGAGRWVVGLVLAAGVAAFLAARRRADREAAGGTDPVLVYPTLRDGRAPDDPAHDERALGLLGRRLAEQRWAVPAAVVALGTLSVLSTLVWLVDGSWFGLASAVVLAAATVWSIGEADRDADRLRSAEDAILGRHPEVDAGTSTSAEVGVGTDHGAQPTSATPPEAGTGDDPLRASG
jgi:hypothetical protein